MQINYAENPLNSVVELDEHDLTILRLKITAEELEHRLSGAHFRLQEGPHFDIEQARRYSDIGEGLDERINERLRAYVEELAGAHIGDCTCVPCSCAKCHAEDLLDVNTVEGLGKHGGHHVSGAFDGGRSIGQAIEWLESYSPVKNVGWLKSDPTGERWNSCLPGWRAEAARAAVWLRNYRETKLAVTATDP